MPIATGYGIDIIHYSMIIILAMGVSIFIPPIGIGFYVSCSVSEKPARRRPARAMLPYLAVLLVGVLIIGLRAVVHALAVPHLIQGR